MVANSVCQQQLAEAAVHTMHRNLEMQPRPLDNVQRDNKRRKLEPSPTSESLIT